MDFPETLLRIHKPSDLIVKCVYVNEPLHCRQQAELNLNLLKITYYIGKQTCKILLYYT